MRAQSEALKHSPLLLEGVVVALAAAEAIPEVLVVLVVHIRLLGVDAALCVRLGIDAQAAWACLRKARGTTIAREIPLRKDLDERVLSVALDGACVTDTGGIVGIRGIRGRRVAGEAGEDALAERAQGLCAVFDALEKLLVAIGVDAFVGKSYVWESFAGISLELHLIMEKPKRTNN